jgi:hypothetical protein
MSRRDKNKPNGKPNRRRAESPTSASQQASANTSPLQVVPADFREETSKSGEEISQPSTSTEGCSGEASAIDNPVSVPVASTQSVPISMQTIANAYENYTRTSVEQTWASMQKVATAPSAAKILELQMEYAKLACDTFITHSQEINELHSELAKQRVTNFQEIVAGIIQTTLVLGAARRPFSSE